MIRRDYILRMIEEFIQALARINTLKEGRRWAEADRGVDEEFQRLIGEGASAVAQLTETELMARLMQGGATQLVHTKVLLLTGLLKVAGDLAVARDQLLEGRSCYLKGLHLLLDALARDDVFESPEFVPTVDMFVTALRDAPLPMRTQALLMRHYERVGEFAKAEDAFYAMLDADPANPGLLEFGIGFYERLLAKSDEVLLAGNLPRPEVESGLHDLRGHLSHGRIALDEPHPDKNQSP